MASRMRACVRPGAIHVLRGQQQHGAENILAAALLLRIIHRF
jgi:hypothetical protein